MDEWLEKFLKTSKVHAEFEVRCLNCKKFYASGGETVLHTLEQTKWVLNTHRDFSQCASPSNKHEWVIYRRVILTGKWELT